MIFDDHFTLELEESDKRDGICLFGGESSAQRRRRMAAKFLCPFQDLNLRKEKN